MGCCPRCGGVNTLDNIDGKAVYCRDCEWARTNSLDRWVSTQLPRHPPPPSEPVPVSLPLLASLQGTTPGGEEGRAEPVRPPWTRDPAERGGPCTGGPTTPPRPQPMPAGIPRRRKPLTTVPAVALALCLALPLLPASSASPLPLHPSLAADGPTFQVFLSFHNSSTNSTVPVSQAVADFLFINDTGLEPVENFSVSNGANYTYSDFAGLNLTNVSTVLVLGHPLSGFPGATEAQAEVDNISSQTKVAIDLVWTSSSPSILPPPNGNGSLSPPPPAFPLFLQLVGVGLFLAFTLLVVAGLRKIVGDHGGEDGA